MFKHTVEQVRAPTQQVRAPTQQVRAPTQQVRGSRQQVRGVWQDVACEQHLDRRAPCAAIASIIIIT